MQPAQRTRPRAPEPGEADLVDRVWAGDRDAFERLVTRAMPRLLGAARRLLGGGFAAEEAVADALVRAWTRRRAFRGDAAFSTWLHRIVCRAAADRFRALARERARRQRLAARPPAPEAPGAHATLCRREARARLRRAVDALPERQRLVVIVHLWEGLDLRETASVLGMRYATAKSHLCHARRALRAALPEDGR